MLPLSRTCSRRTTFCIGLNFVPYINPLLVAVSVVCCVAVLHSMQAYGRNVNVETMRASQTPTMTKKRQLKPRQLRRRKKKKPWHLKPRQQLKPAQPPRQPSRRDCASPPSASRASGRCTAVARQTAQSCPSQIRWPQQRIDGAAAGWPRRQSQRHATFDSHLSVPGPSGS